MSELVYIPLCGLDTLPRIFDEGEGFLLAFKVSGALSVKGRNASYDNQSGTFMLYDLSKGRQFEDIGKTAYALVKGEFISSLLSCYGITDGFRVYAPECAETFFELLRYAEGNEREAAFLIHTMLHTASKAQSPLVSPRADTAEMIREYLDCHAIEKVGLEELSGIFFLSRSQIFRIFKSRYGKAPMQYHMEKKIEKAKEMLGDATLRVSDIAEALGFADAKHLTTAFKKHTGMLPRNYRKNIIEDKKGLME